MKKIILLAIVGVLAFASCSKNNDDNENKGKNPPVTTESMYHFGIQKGKVTYNSTYSNEDGTETTAITVIFDDYGERVRIEYEDFVLIFNEKTEKAYYLYPESKRYSNMDYTSTIAARIGFLYFGDDANSTWGYLPGYAKKANKTICGKNCTMYGWTYEGETVEWSGWNRITFWTKIVDESGTDQMEATSFTENISADSFEVPSDYTSVAE